MNQLAIDFDAPRAAGEAAGQRCIDKARRTDPFFAEKAEAAILAPLRVVRRASGEELTNIARAHGAVPHDDRAFGPVYGSLSRRGVIRTAAMCMRSKGNGTAGGRVWELVMESDA